MTDRWQKQARELATHLGWFYTDETKSALIATALSDAYEAGRREEREACAEVADREALDAKSKAYASVTLRMTHALNMASGLMEDVAAAIRSRENKA